MSVRIGINPLSWTNDDLPTLGADTTLETCLTEGKQAGFSGFELGQKFPRDPAVLEPILKNYELDLVSGWFSGELLTRSVEEEIEAIKPHLHLLKTLGAKVMVYCEVTDCIHGEIDTPLSHRPRLTEERIAEFGKKLTQVADFTLSEGVQIAYHHHMGTVIQTEEDVALLMKHTGPSVGLLLDTGHMTFAGGDPYAVQERHADRINHVHCKDMRKDILADALNRDLPFLRAMLNGTFTVPSDGFIDYGRLFKQLKASNYSGWLVVEAEQDPSVAHPLTYATKGANGLKQFCQDAGLDLIN
ncbi:myo-inosose-2 dehydratase [Marinomonas rhizomae]|uniref:2-keto-myo-inositol dehydratase n=1 Tax=Marinomonas rhizomae TaxID=491948 RepID=A0A366J0G5_9GAMM|nr:myo-inosose-2 dehydratase [Marinomonas rhizomae]RBP79448.1 2-keto-myo-inositol dehydratase [Marinomonas rhizomae]RNF71373.1 myo-inosose-2 dehydratase [Marinomonas rhizomae]